MNTPDKKLNDQECPVCKSKKIEICYTDIYNLTVSPDRFSVLKCTECSHAFTFPVPDLNSITHFYGEDYYSYNVNIDEFNNKTKFRIKKWLYTSDNRNLPSRVLRKIIGNQIAIFPDIKKSDEKLKILDIGCGNGAFLSFMKALNLETYGVEISSKAIEIARRNGHQVLMGTIEDALFPDDFFDIITMNNVLEHLQDPLSALKKLNRFLKPGGELIICVPNFNSLSRKAFGKVWDGLAIPWHFHHFSMKSLKKATESVNFINSEEKYIYRDIIRSSLINYSGRNKKDFNYYSLFMKGIGLHALSYIIFPLFFFKIGKKSCPFITLHSYKA